MNPNTYYSRMAHRVRENGKKISVFDKVNRIKNDLKQILPEIEDKRLLPMMSHCRQFYEGNLYHGRRTNDPAEKKKRQPKELTQAEKVLYEYLLKNEVNPSTAYRWFLACRVPDDIKDKLAKNQISYRKAVEISNNRRRVKESNTGLLMMEEMRTVIGGL